VEKLIHLSWKAFYVMYVLAFAPGILFIFFRSRTGTSNILLPLITVVLVLPLLVNVWRLCGRIAPAISGQTHRLILVAFIIVSAILQIYLGNRLRFTPLWDMEAIFEGGRLWVLTGHLDNDTVFHGTYHRYFAMFSNQWGGLVLFRNIFWVYDLFGGTDFHRPALYWNVFMVQAMVFALYSAARRVHGLQAGLFVLCFLCIFLPFHFFGAVYYTDTLSLPFVAIAFALYLRGRDEESLRNRLLFFAACGLVIAVGALIKATALVVVIAITIDHLLVAKKEGLHRRFISIGVAGIIFVMVFGGFNMYMSRRVICPEMTDRHRIPRMHWAMMGLHGEGHYNPQDFDFTMSIPDLATRQSATASEFNRRLRDLGVTGLASLYAAKFSINFGDGTYEMHRILHSQPVNITRLHELTLSQGPHFNGYMHIASGFTSALLLLMLAGAVHAIRKNDGLLCTAVPWLSYFGLALLLTFWEAGGRLAMNHFPLLVIGAILGLAALDKALPNTIGPAMTTNKGRRRDK